MKRILVLIILCLGTVALVNAQVKANNDTIAFRNDTNLNANVYVLRNDTSFTTSNMKVFKMVKSGSSQFLYKIEFGPDSAFIQLLDTLLSSSYTGTFRYFIKDNFGNIDSANVVFSRIAMTPQVFPGETNKDNLVNHFDLFALGLAFGESGSARHNADTGVAFVPRRVNDWFFQRAGINGKFADIDGNGIVNTTDVNRLSSLLGKSSGTYAPKLSPPSAATRLVVSFQDTVEVKIDSPKLTIPITFSAASPISAYGLGYSYSVINRNGSVGNDTLYRKHSFLEQKLWTTGNQLFLKDTASIKDRTNVAFSRFDKINVGTGGEAGIVEIVVDVILGGLATPGELGVLQLNLENVALIDNSYNLIPISPISKTIYIRKSKSGVVDVDRQKFQVYPTLVDGSIQIELANSKPTGYAISNAMGQVIQTGMLAQKITSLETNIWAPGIYYFKLESSATVVRLLKM